MKKMICKCYEKDEEEFGYDDNIEEEIPEEISEELIRIVPLPVWIAFRDAADKCKRVFTEFTHLSKKERMDIYRECIGNHLRGRVYPR